MIIILACSSAVPHYTVYIYLQAGQAVDKGKVQSIFHSVTGKRGDGSRCSGFGVLPDSPLLVNVRFEQDNPPNIVQTVICSDQSPRG